MPANPLDALTPKGWELCFGADSRSAKGWLATLALTTGGRLHWWQMVTVPNRWGGKTEGGAPDFGLHLDGTTHWTECKNYENATAAEIGRLTAAKDASGNDKNIGTGVKPDQAEWMDLATKSGATCWIAVQLEVSAATLRKSAQQRLDGSGGDLPRVIRRLIPWPAWRALMAAAEDCRRRGEVPDASIPAADLAAMGWPCRSAAELLVALQGNK